MDKLKYVLIFAAGAGVGILASRTYFCNKYEAIADEEIESVKAAYSYKKEPVATQNDVDNMIEDIERTKLEYRDILDKTYSNTSIVEEVIEEDHPREEIGGVYEISEEDFSENELTYDKVTLQYFVDDDILFNVDENEIVVEQTIGDEGINAVRTSGDTYTLYFRNDTYGADYEVVKVAGSYYEDK